MPYVKENGRFRFQPDEWLTTKQIKSFFSTLTSNRRRNSNPSSSKPSARRNSRSSNSKPPARRSSTTSNSKRSSRRKQADSSYISNFQDQHDTSLMDTNTQDTSDIVRSTSEVNSENDDEIEEEDEEDFDGKLISMDIDDILDSARKTLTLHAQE